MGAVRLIFDETTNQLKHLGDYQSLNTQGTRKIMQSNLRYCLQGNTLFLPRDTTIISDHHRLCWGRIRSEMFEELPWLQEFDKTLDHNPLELHSSFGGTGFGVMYHKRHRETDQGRVSVSSFVSQDVIDQIAKHPEALEHLGKNDFESLIAELCARRGFEVDLYRGSKDGGIDFLAVNSGEGEPIILCVQCKHPDKANAGKKRRPLPVATVREIYGVAKANDLHGCIAVTSSTYTPDAKSFADLKKDEIAVADAVDVHSWIQRYRWNHDE